MKKFLVAAALIGLTSSAVEAQTIVGTWQTATPRYEMTITKTKSGYRGEWYNLGETGGSLNGNPLKVGLDGKTITINPVRTPGTFRGTVAPDGKSITGDWGDHDPEKLTLERVTAQTAHPIDPSPHKVRFVTVAKGVKLEVLDWGGSGSPLVFLAGQGNTAHEFDTLAMKFTATHHVYAITRRGYGISSWPAPTDENYDADRLGDDVLAVADALNLAKPVLAGHSVAGEELSSIGTRHPEKIAGLVYLDAAHPFAFYDPQISYAYEVSESIMRRDLERLKLAEPGEARALIREIQTILPNFQQGLQSKLDSLANQPDVRSQAPSPRRLVGITLDANEHIYNGIKVPILVLAAVPQQCHFDCDSAAAKTFQAMLAAQADSVQAHNPTARVVKLAGDHAIFRSNEADVVREMNAFMDGLPR